MNQIKTTSIFTYYWFSDTSHIPFSYDFTPFTTFVFAGFPMLDKSISCSLYLPGFSSKMKVFTGSNF